MALRDGDGWAQCGSGHRHWGIFGAVGLLAYGPVGGAPAEVSVLLALRGGWSQHGGTWGPPGGARDSDEPPPAAALREAHEECGLPPEAVDVGGVLADEHGGWSYQTYVAAAASLVPVRPARPEISEAAWVPAGQVDELALHPGFAATWPVLCRALQPVWIIVDGANVMGSRADGWWRDRAGAALRLHGQLAVFAERGVAGLQDELGLPPLTRWYPGVVLVVEGAARSAGFGDAAHLRVVAAPGSGDDEIVHQAAVLPGKRLVVTADRELRRRCAAAGAAVTGPGWLLSRL